MDVLSDGLNVSYLTRVVGTLERAVTDPALRKLVPERQLDFLAKAMPFLREKYPSYGAFARASIEEMLSERAKAVRRLRVRDLRSVVFLNRGGKFTARPLPVEAQMAPAVSEAAQVGRPVPAVFPQVCRNLGDP